MSCAPGRRIATITWLLLGATLGPAVAGAADGPVDFNLDVRPILATHCLACHGRDAETRKAGLRLDQRDSATATLDSGATAIVPGDPEASDLIFRVTEEDETVRMPPKGGGVPLKAEEVAVLRRWIEQGAPYDEHWAFLPPVDRPLPPVEDASWPRNGIDYWVLDRLEREGLHPSPEADRFILLRRASLDLRGLPPTPEEVAAFAADASPDAFEKAVDRFLDDPAFGERWARVWLDLARYADSAGYGSDPLRTNMWRYRDWVIDAFNRNLPYDRFAVEQLAGDLLPEPTLEQRMATAFHRNTMTNTEGGTDDEEWRIAAVKDRVDTTGQVFLGLTVGCAKCHSHKFDPISQEEYYSLVAVFNQTADNDQPDERPTIPAPTPEIAERNRRIDAEVAALKAKLDESTPDLVAAQSRWEASLAERPEWTVVEPCEARAESGATLERLEDGSFLVVGERPDRDAYTIVANGSPEGIAAIRLEAIPDATLPAGGSGRADDGNFVLSKLSAEVGPADEAPPVGRFVRVEIPGDREILSLAEVEVLRGGVNVARDGKAEQSSTDYEGTADRAIDGNTNGHYFEAKSTTHTRSEANPWWEVRLAQAGPVERIAVWNRTDGDVGRRLAKVRVQVLDDARTVVWQGEIAEAPRPTAELSPTGRRSIALKTAAADFAQGDFAVDEALGARDLSNDGWAVAPKQNEPHAAVFAPAEPLKVSAGEALTIRLEHRYKDPGFLLGRFRLSWTRSDSATRRAAVPAEILAILDTPAEARTDDQRETLARHYRSIAPELQPIRDEIARLESSRPEVPTLPVMVELPEAQRRTTHLLNKGNFLDPGAEVEPGVPAFLNPLPEGSQPDRLGLARWIVDEDNPLTARVAVNRFWARLFGVGIVETEEDFGTQGDLPSHPELLDWLAREYVRSGWDTKALLRTIVTSATYRQTSRVTPELLEKDPNNRLLARAPRFRLEAEMVRDQALALGGLLSREIGGPSVFPPQPEGLWQAAFNGERTWATSTGDDAHRRALYTFWRRTVPYPSMAAFDAPSREVCTVRRSRTNTPLQAFVTMNDPVYVEAAQGLARRVLRDGGECDEDRIRFALALCLCRPADAEQTAILADLLDAEKARFAADPDAAKALATGPIGPVPEGADAAELAAWTTVANVLLNLDAVLTKG